MTGFFLKKTGSLLKNRLTNCALKNWFSITIKRVHATYRNIRTLLRVIRLLYIYIYI
jgi:hypothetical protein